MNYTSLIVNSFSFTLYNVSIIGLYTSYLIYSFRMMGNPDPAEVQIVRRYCLIAWISTCFTNFVAQLCLIWIFLQFRPHTDQEPEKTMRTVQVVDQSVVRMGSFDEEFN